MNTTQANFVLLARGQTYPMQLPEFMQFGEGGAAAQFLNKTGNILQIMVPDMDAKEQTALRSGMIKSDLLYKNGAMLMLFQFYGNNGKPIFSFDAPFDVRVWSDNRLDIPHLSNEQQRLTIEIHAVDEKLIVRALRVVSMPPELTQKFISAALDQLVEKKSGDEQMNEWLQEQPEVLLSKTKGWILGK